MVELVRRCGYLSVEKTSLGDHTRQRNTSKRKIIGVRDQAWRPINSVCNNCLHGFDIVVIDLC